MRLFSRSLTETTPSENTKNPKNNPKNFQYVGKSLKDDDETFKLAFQQVKELLRYASERLQKLTIQS